MKNLNSFENFPDYMAFDEIRRIFIFQILRVQQIAAFCEVADFVAELPVEFLRAGSEMMQFQDIGIINIFNSLQRF